MKTAPLTIIVVLSASLLIACHNPDQKWDSKSSADTLNNMKDSVADPNKSITKDLVMKVNKTDAKFAVAAANGGMAEVVLGKLAKSNAAGSEVKDFGYMMVNDHSKANEKLELLAKSKGISLPDTTSNDEQKLSADLAKKKGNAFDKAYVKAMIEDHQEDIKEFQEAINTLTDPDLKRFAVETLPVLKTHLDAIKRVNQHLK